MATSLDTIRRKLLARTRSLDLAFERHALAPIFKVRTDRFAVQEGLLSSLWQSWCTFCRETIISSAQGISTKTGHKTTSPYAGNSEMEIAFVARELSQKRVVNAVKILPARHLEPTWGDLVKINLIATGIGSSNAIQLTSAFGAGMTIIDLQMCRNASAHLNFDTISNVISARVRYSQTKFVHPSDMMFWIDPATKDYLWKTWIEEISILSDLAIA